MRQPLAFVAGIALTMAVSAAQQTEAVKQAETARNAPAARATFVDLYGDRKSVV